MLLWFQPQMAYNVAYGKDQRHEDSREASLADYDEGYLAPVPSADPPLPEGYSYVTPDPPERDQSPEQWTRVTLVHRTCTIGNWGTTYSRKQNPP